MLKTYLLVLTNYQNKWLVCFFRVHNTFMCIHYLLPKCTHCVFPSVYHCNHRCTSNVHPGVHRIYSFYIKVYILVYTECIFWCALGIFGVHPSVHRIYSFYIKVYILWTPNVDPGVHVHKCTSWCLRVHLSGFRSWCTLSVLSCKPFVHLGVHRLYFLLSTCTLSLHHNVHPCLHHGVHRNIIIKFIQK